MLYLSERSKYFLLFAFVTVFGVITGVSIYYAQKSLNNDGQKVNQDDQSKDQNSAQNDSKPSEFFVVLGDTGNKSPEQFQVAESVDKYCEQVDCESILIAGDVIYPSGITSVTDKRLQTQFEEPYKSIDLPFYIAYGNHDYKGCVDCFLEYANISTRWKMPAKYYSVEFENTEFFIVNTEEFTSEQADWLKNSLNQSNAIKKVVVGHRPLLTYEELHTGEQWDGIEEFKSAVCNRADFYIAGHSHLLEDVGVIEGCKVHQIVSGGGGAQFRDVVADEEDQFYYVGNGFVSVEVGGSELNDKSVVRFFDATGEKIYEITK